MFSTSNAERSEEGGNFGRRAGCWKICIRWKDDMADFRAEKSGVCQGLLDIHPKQKHPQMQSSSCYTSLCLVVYNRAVLMGI